MSFRRQAVAVVAGAILLAGVTSTAYAADLTAVHKEYPAATWGTMSYPVVCPTGVAVTGYGLVENSLTGSMVSGPVSSNGSGSTWNTVLIVPSSGGPYTVKVSAICRD